MTALGSDKLGSSNRVLVVLSLQVDFSSTFSQINVRSTVPLARKNGPIVRGIPTSFEG